MLMDLICSWSTTTSIFTGFEDNTMDASYIPGEKVDFLADSLLFLLCPFMINTRKNDEQDSKDGENDSIDNLFHFKNKYFGLCTHE